MGAENDIWQLVETVMQEKERRDSIWGDLAEAIRRAHEIVDAELGVRGDSLERVILVGILVSAAVSRLEAGRSLGPSLVPVLPDECPHLETPVLSPDPDGGWALTCRITGRHCQAPGHMAFPSCLHFRMSRLVARRRAEEA